MTKDGDGDGDGDGWTLWTLNQNFRQRIKDERRAVRTALAASDRALEIAKATADLAIAKADKSASDRVKEIAELSARVTVLEGRSGGFNSAWAYFVGAIGLMAAAWAAFAK